MTVAGVVDDAVIGAAEVAFTLGGVSAGSPLPRYLLAHYDRDRAEVEVAIRGVVAPEVPVRFRGPGETPFFRQGDAVLAQVFIRSASGSSRSADAEGKTIEIDPVWERANLVSRNHPILGRMRCHKDLLPGARRGVARLGAAQPRVCRGLLRGLLEPRAHRRGRRSLARCVGCGGGPELRQEPHPAGVRAGRTPRGGDGALRFTWGGNWLVPDPAHFEYLRLPRPDTDPARVVENGGMQIYDKLYIDGAWVALDRHRHHRRDQRLHRRGHGPGPRGHAGRRRPGRGRGPRRVPRWSQTAGGRARQVPAAPRRGPRRRG